MKGVKEDGHISMFSSEKMDPLLARNVLHIRLPQKKINALTIRNVSQSQILRSLTLLEVVGEQPQRRK